MKVKEAKEKYCPLTFAKTFEEMSLKCEPIKCMWWIDKGREASREEGDRIGECAITDIIQTLYDTRREDK